MSEAGYSLLKVLHIRIERLDSRHDRRDEAFVVKRNADGGGLTCGVYAATGWWTPNKDSIATTMAETIEFTC